jgi:hypothetical protein
LVSLSDCEVGKAPPAYNVSVAKTLVIPPFQGLQPWGATFPGAALLRRLPLAVIFRAVGAEIPVTTFVRGSEAYRTTDKLKLIGHKKRESRNWIPFSNSKEN